METGNDTQSSGEKKEKDLILIADDDATFRKLIAKIATQQGFDIREAENGLVAKTIFDLLSDKVKLVITDVRMPELDGMALIQHIREKSEVPVLLVTGFTDIADVNTAQVLGATKFLKKPFGAEELIEAVQKCLNPQPEPAPDQEIKPPEAPKYCAIHIDEFISTSQLLSDLYLRLTEKNHVKIARKGEKVPLERLKFYKDKRVEYLFVTQEDFSSYVEFNIRLASVAAKSDRLSAQKKARLLKNTTEILVEKCFVSELNQDVVRPAQAMLEATLNLVSEDSDILEMFANIANKGDMIYSHSVAVSVFSCIVAREHGWGSTSTLFKTSLAGLLHDIGLKEVDPEIINKKRIHCSADDIKDLQSHSVRGRDLILQLKSVPEDVSTIVSQHHETPTGTGYPYRLRGDQIHPLARLIGTVDRFAELAVPISENQERYTPADALRRIHTLTPGDVDIDFLRHLMRLFNISDANIPGQTARA